MSPTNRTTSRRTGSIFAALALLSTGALVGVSSCRAVVAGDGVDAATDLCNLLTRCYGKDVGTCADLRHRFGDRQVDDQFLSFLGQNDCLSSCNLAKKCADYPPLCEDGGTACERNRECCGATTGHQVCAGGQCCAPAGVPCSDGDTCCLGLECKRTDDGAVQTCGGIAACKDLGQTCGDNIDCCSRFCDHQKCAAKTCSSPGEKCGDGKTGPTCCPDPQGAVVACVNGTCTQQTCRPSTCDVRVECDPEADPATVCCGDPSLRCVRDVNNSSYGICVSSNPEDVIQLPKGFDCAYPSDCCPGLSCVLAGVFQCGEPVFGCVSKGGQCTSNPLGGSDCCSGDCVDGVCACGLTSCHSPFQEGPPLACQPGDPALQADCPPSKVCATDPFCCCNQWDGICVGEAIKACGPPVF